MSSRSKREYTEAVHLRYKKAFRSEKTVILEEFCATCRCHRKHAIRVLRGLKRFSKPKARKRGKPSIYQHVSVLETLKTIWLKENLPCSKRLKAILPIWLPGYMELFGKLSYNVIDALRMISPATIDRILRLHKAGTKHHQASNHP